MLDQLKGERLIEITLNSTKDLWSVLYRVARVIQQKNNIPEYAFYSDSILQGLPEAEYKFYLIWQWINYIQLECPEMVNQTPEEVIEVLRQLSLDRHVQMIYALQQSALRSQKFEKEFIVESEIGEALLRLMREQSIKQK